MGGRYVSAMCFVPLEARPASDAALFEAVGGAQNMFGPLVIEERGIEVLDYHVRVWLAFLRTSFFGLIRSEGEVPLEHDRALPLAVALRDGAARSGADAAMLVTEAHRMAGVQDWYWMVAAREPHWLLKERFPALYLGDAVVRDWTPPEGLLDDRDELPGGPGRTFFAQRGADRWY